MITIALLADHLETIPTLAEWFRAQWPDYFAGRMLEAIAQDFLTEANRDRIPVRLVAFEDGNLAGTVVLRKRAVDALPAYTPGLGGLFVPEPFRRRSVGSELVHAGMEVAQDLGITRLYAGTVAARGLLERLGWTLVEWVQFEGSPHGSESAAIYCTLKP